MCCISRRQIVRSASSPTTRSDLNESDYIQGLRKHDCSSLPAAFFITLCVLDEAERYLDTERSSEIMQNESLPIRRIIGSPVTALPYDDQISLILTWAKQRLSKSVCVANVHMIIEAYRNSSFATVLRQSDLVTPDGMPLVWMLRQLGVSNQDRIAGMDMLITLLDRAPTAGVSIFFVGSEDATLDRMKSRLAREYPNLKVAGIEPLPFRPLTPEEDSSLIQRINESGAGLVLVALGCPKQETWIANHRGRIQAVMVGLGGAFPVYAGLHKRAPQLMRSLGLEWLYRLMQEPRRLWSRYLNTIPIFVWLALKQLITNQPDQPDQKRRFRI